MEMTESQVDALVAGRSAEVMRARAAGAPRFLGEIAMYDERLAYTLLQAAKLDEKNPNRMYSLQGPGWVATQPTRGWEIVNVKARFDSTAADKQVVGQTLGVVETELWVRRVTYTVRRPRFALGSIWKAQSDYFNKLNPNIDVNPFIIHGFCNYIIADEATPLENIEAVFECVCPAGLVLTCDANIEAFFTILRQLSDDEVPTEVIISLHGTRLPRGIYPNCAYADVIAALRAEGLFNPREPGPVCGP